MTVDVADPIDEVIKRVSALQKFSIVSQETIKSMQRQQEKTIDQILLQLIDLLDLIDAFKKNEPLCSEDKNNRVLFKIEKRLLQILAHLDTHEIEFPNNKISPGKTRVIETQESTGDVKTGEIINICRKGYQRGDSVIRSADVIAVK